MQDCSTIPIQSLHSILRDFGDIIELDYNLGPEALEELKALELWHSGPGGKLVVNFNGVDIHHGPGTETMAKHDIGQEYNANGMACPTVKKFFDEFDGSLARCRGFKMNAGSFFAPHRDAWRFNSQFRIFIPLNKVDSTDMHFFLDGNTHPFKVGVPYVLNTRKVHGAFCFVDGIYWVVMSIFLNKNSLETIFKYMPNTTEKGTRVGL